MGLKFILITAALAANIAVIYKIYSLFEPVEVPEMKYKYWGSGESKPDNEDVFPFKIEVTPEQIQDVHLRINRSRYIDSLENTKHEYGFNNKTLKEILDYLKYNYNITDRLKELNKFPQYITMIQGLNIHFVHVKPSNNLETIPILMLHGWPSSVHSYYKLITMLSQNEYNFEIVVASLPGYGYSDAPAKPGLDSSETALVFKNLMERLGHKRFFIYGEDWGAIVSQALATLFPQSVLGLHSNFCASFRYISLLKMGLGFVFPSIYPQEYRDKYFPVLNHLGWLLSESGYFHLQASKPDSVGTALDNSLEGLIAYTLEKLSVGTNKTFIFEEDSGLKKYCFEAVLDNILFYYWFPKKATTSIRFYTENLTLKSLGSGILNIPISEEVPCGCAFFQNEFFYQPSSILKDKFTRLIQNNHYKIGGHFIAFEQPELIANDIISFIDKVLK